jgi:hypothetical protein
MFVLDTRTHENRVQARSHLEGGFRDRPITPKSPNMRIFRASQAPSRPVTERTQSPPMAPPGPGRIVMPLRTPDLSNGEPPRQTNPTDAGDAGRGRDVASGRETKRSQSTPVAPTTTGRIVMPLRTPDRGKREPPRQTNPTAIMAAARDQTNPIVGMTVRDQTNPTPARRSIGGGSRQTNPRHGVGRRNEPNSRRLGRDGVDQKNPAGCPGHCLNSLPSKGMRSR